MAAERSFNNWVEYLHAVAREKSKVPFVDLQLAEEPQDINDVFLPLSVKTYKEWSATGNSSLRSGRLTENAKEAGDVCAHSEVSGSGQELERLVCPGHDKKPVRCLLLSRPGCGKTMTCYQILNLWESKRSFTRFKAVVYLAGQEKEKLTAKELEKLLPGLDEEAFDEDLTKKLIIEYLVKHGEELLIIVDAVDESGCDSLFQVEGKGPHSILATLFSQSKSQSSQLGKLTATSLIATSRPCPAAQYLICRGCCHPIVCLDGFTDNSLQQLFAKRLKGKKQHQLGDYLDNPNHAQLKDTIVKMPLLATMIVAMGNERQLPSTVAEVYKIMEEDLAERQKQKSIARRCAEMPEGRAVLQLSFRAYQQVKKNAVALTEEDFAGSQPAAQVALDSGILVKDQPKVRGRSRTTYRFIHLTWLEFMAARWIAHVAEQQLLKSVQKCVNEIHLVNQRRFFWRLVVGLLTHVSHVVNLLKELREEANKNRSFSTSVRLFFMSCILEWLNSKASEQQELSRSNMEQLASTLFSTRSSLHTSIARLELDGHTFTKTDIHLVCSFLQRFNSVIVSAQFKCCSIEKEQCKPLGEHLQKLSHFTLEYVNFEGKETAFSELVKRLLQLRLLKLNYCGLSQLHATSLKQLLRCNQKLETLYLIGNQLKTGGVHTVCKGIGKGSCLQTVMFNGNGLNEDIDGSEGSQAFNNIGQALANAEKLKSVCFTDNFLSNQHLESLLSHLVCHAHLEDIWLRRNNFDDLSLKHISVFLRQHNDHLLSSSFTADGKSGKLSNEGAVSHSSVTIHLENNDDITEDGLRRLASTLPDVCSDKVCWNCRIVTFGKVSDEDYEKALKPAEGRRKGKLWVNDHGMTDKAVECFVASRVFKVPDVRLDLLLDHNKIGDKGAESLANRLKSGPNIRTLQLADNKIGIIGFHKLMDILEDTNIEHLILTENPIFSDVCAGDGFYHMNNSLRYLDLSYTEMDTEHGCQLAELLEVHQTLYFLSLSNNHLGDKFAMHFGECLSKNTALSLIELSSTDITNDGAEILSTNLAKKDAETCVECIWLGGNNISSQLFRMPLVDGSLRLPLVETILDLLPSASGNND